MANLAGLMGGLLKGGTRGYMAMEDEQRRDELANQQAALRKLQMGIMQQNQKAREQAQERASRQQAVGGMATRGLLQGASPQEVLSAMEATQPGYDPAQYLPQGFLTYQSPERQLQLKQKYAPKEWSFQQIMGESGKPMLVAVNANDPSSIMVLGQSGKMSPLSGGDLAFAVGPDGKGQYLPKTAMLPEGFQWSTPQAEEKKSKALEKEEEGKRQQEFYAGVVLDDIDRAKDLIKKAEIPATGFWGAQLSKVPGTAAHDLDAVLDSIRGNISFTRLQQMREASPTGGALGAVSERELGLLSSVLGSLRQSQSEEELLYNLNRLENAYDVIVNPISKERLEKTLVGIEKNIEPNKSYGIEIGTIEDGYRYNGGDPADPNSWEAQ